ncbi:MAG: hypothetical protein JJ885_12935 [Muricauda sp.]|nr:hypothetical protein [Allomuricauda sp.]MBO6590188.1 hypothetical protein [Allomuricauda sp.]MBO6619664.1 hypothetical protein [Allomuricauda sp.]MBO6645709.1 hypothetical protein [Allomuricauda sp.]MBO6748002.1 hypothetical protein [Allomuricauda sp.]MBO6845242.1 hypothetical protein [Allomuricauda sp.]
MDGLEKAELKDRIIKLIQEQSTNRFGTNALDRELGSPTKSTAHLIMVIEEMIKEAPFVFDYSGSRNMGYTINCNDFTQDFLDNDGFVKRFDEREEIRQGQLIEQEEVDKDLKNQRVKNKWQAKLAKWQVYTFWPLFLLGVFGGGYSIYQVLNPKEYVTIEEFQKFKESTQKATAEIKDAVQ